jgi:hypothetical protein
MNSITRAKFNKLSPHNRDGLSLNRVERLISTCKAALSCHNEDDFSYTGLNNSNYGHNEVIAGFVYGAEKPPLTIHFAQRLSLIKLHQQSCQPP